MYPRPDATRTSTTQHFKKTLCVCINTVYINSISWGSNLYAGFAQQLLGASLEIRLIGLISGKCPQKNIQEEYGRS
jgi:hypothetical protein